MKIVHRTAWVRGMIKQSGAGQNPSSKEEARSRQEGRAGPCPLTYTAPARRASNAAASFTPVMVDHYG